MIISRASVTFRVLGSRSRSLWLFFKENFVIDLAPIFIDDLIKLHTLVGYDNISIKIDCQVSVSIFWKKKTLCHRSSAYIYQWILI